MVKTVCRRCTYTLLALLLAAQPPAFQLLLLRWLPPSAQPPRGGSPTQARHPQRRQALT